MKITRLLLAVAPIALASPAFGATADNASEQDAAATGTPAAKAPAPAGDMVTTGVARGRDRLDSATSTSVLKSAEINKLGARSLGEILRYIPGIRSEYAGGGEGSASLSVRGLPLALGGSKFLQIQEDGLPTLEFGDISFATADTFLRADLNLAQIESIRGGSASTFSSNSPGGIINLQSKTGDVEGGAVEMTTGLDYETWRLDFDYGAKLSDTLRFHVGGFYRQGEGPRRAGYDAYRGGQLKFNVTKEFAGGYVRLYGKYLDDRTPYVWHVPAMVSGTDADPSFTDIAGFSINQDIAASASHRYNLTLDGNNAITRTDRRDGMHALVKSLGVEAQFDVAGWTVTERFRFSDISGSFNSNLVVGMGPAQALATSLAGPGAVLSYASGPNAGRVIASPATLNGNGLLALMVPIDNRFDNLNNMTNDVRASRVWDMGEGKLTATVGFYKASQNIGVTRQWTSGLMDIAGQGNASLINVATAGGTAQTQDGTFAFGTYLLNPSGGYFRNVFDVKYNVNAPYASLNYHVGKIAIGGSVRYDFGDASGSLIGSDLGGGRVGLGARDMNGDGVISAAESRTSVFPIGSPAPVNYEYDYLSYSMGINYRVAEPFSVFARYSRGGRAASDRILFGTLVSPVTGALTKPDADHDPVKQAEIGLKYRNGGLTLNATGFWAKTHETNMGIERDYRAIGIELEGSYRAGPFMLAAGGTYTDAKITDDQLNASFTGKRPKHAAKFIFQATPQVDLGRLTLGGNIIGTTSSYATDTNQLKLPGYTVVGAFAQFRPADRVTVSVNANNLFDVNGIMESDQATIPASKLVTVRGIHGRTVSASLRLDF